MFQDISSTSALVSYIINFFSFTKDLSKFYAKEHRFLDVKVNMFLFQYVILSTLFYLCGWSPVPVQGISES